MLFKADLRSTCPLLSMQVGRACKHHSTILVSLITLPAEGLASLVLALANFTQIVKQDRILKIFFKTNNSK